MTVMFAYEQLLACKGYFAEIILRRGYSYYLDSTVLNLRHQQNSLQATVLGSTSYRIHLNLDYFPSSSCTCPYDDYCKHMAAVLFEMINRMGYDPQALLSKSQQQGKSRLTKEKMIEQHPAQQLPQETQSVADWHFLFAQLLGPRTYSGTFSVDSLLADANQTLLPICRTWAPGKQALYKLHIWFYTRHQIEVMFAQNKTYSTYYRHYHMHQAKQWMQNLILIVQELTSTEYLRFDSIELQDTARHLAEICFSPYETITDWSMVYRLLWNQVLWHDTRVHEEQLRLRTELIQAPNGTIRRQLLLQALLYFELLLQNDQEAIKIVQNEHQNLRFSSLSPYLESFVSYEDWDRLKLWLQALKQYMHHDSSHQIEWLRLWKSLYQHERMDHLEWEQILSTMLPASQMEYADLLISQKKYQEWVELHLNLEIPVHELDRKSLKEIQAQNPAWLLPLYHQTTERLILEKTRPAYKEAVKAMKKLKSLYQKLHQKARWERYLEIMCTRYKRYRAFQEELKKGKLIL